MGSVQTVVALAGGSFIFLGVALLMLVGVIYGFYTRKGSGIDQHPSGKNAGAPGAVGATEVSGQDQGESSALETHGTR
jgi:hypothetical protein